MEETLGVPLLASGDPPSKRKILASALHLFVRDGVCETTIRDIGREAGYTNPALYKFFAGKEALALYLFERCYEHLYATIEETQRKRGPFAARLEALVGAYFSLLQDNLEAVLYVNEMLRTFWPRLPEGAKRRSLLRLTGELIEEGISEGAIPAATDRALAVGLVLGTMAQVARMVYFGEIEGDQRELSGAMTVLLQRALTEKVAR